MHMVLNPTIKPRVVKAAHCKSEVRSLGYIHSVGMLGYLEAGKSPIWEEKS